jgi:hypothetical protein
MFFFITNFYSNFNILDKGFLRLKLKNFSNQIKNKQLL